MKLNEKAIGMETMKARLSTLWVFIMINMLTADIFSFMLQASESNAPLQVTQGLMLALAFVIEIPIAMILLSRTLKHRLNRLVNIVAGVVTILFVVAGYSLTLHYIFFASIEVVAMLQVIRYAWMWTDPEDETAARN